MIDNPYPYRTDADIQRRFDEAIEHGNAVARRFEEAVAGVTFTHKGANVSEDTSTQIRELEAKLVEATKRAEAAEEKLEGLEEGFKEFAVYAMRRDPMLALEVLVAIKGKEMGIDPTKVTEEADEGWGHYKDYAQGIEPAEKPLNEADTGSGVPVKRTHMGSHRVGFNPLSSGG